MFENTDMLGRGVGVLLMLWANAVVAQPYHFAGGTGAPDDPYQIATAEQLISIGSDPNLLDKHYILVNDVDLDPNLPGGRVFTRAVIAADTHDLGMFEGIPFTGGFDGRGYKIRNLIIRPGGGQYLALFGYVGKEAVVRDLGMEDAEVGVQQGGYCGALAGGNDGRIARCYAEARVRGSYSAILVGMNRGEIIECWAAGEVAGHGGVGGLVGYNAPGVIVRSHAAPTILMTDKGRGAGGLVGTNLSGVIVNCYATGDVSATIGEYLGGLVGESSGDGIIAHCYASGNVSIGDGGGTPRRPAYNYLGGLVGYQNGGSIYACYAHGDVSAGDNSGVLGGLVGSSNSGYISDCYASGRVSAGKDSQYIGPLTGAGISKVEACFWNTEMNSVPTGVYYGVGLTTAQMQDIGTFVAAGWDCANERANGTADLWFIPEGGGYPVLTVHSTAFQPHGLEGSGTADDPYRIATAEDLGAINHYDPAASYRLEVDIDLGGIAWRKAPIQYFGGQFDGAGKLVANLSIQGDSHLGLFADLGREASVVNLGVRDADIRGRDVLGILAGMNRGRIRACSAGGSVAGESYLGGLAGWNEGGVIDSYAIGDVTASFTSGVGGLTGRNIGQISRCYAAADISWLGFNFGSSDCAGGLVGVNNYFLTTGDIRDSYFLIDADGGGPDNSHGTPLTDAQMKQQASFVGWDFENTWTIREGANYPHLRW